MKLILHSIVFLILVISISGCSKCPEPEVVTEYKYLKIPLPNIPDKPLFVKYNMFEANFNGDDFYVIPRNDGAILSSNWESYKDWAETNYKILKALENLEEPVEVNSTE